MAINQVTVGKIFSFDSSHQLIGHCGKCANLHGHTYKLEVMLKGQPHQVIGSSDEGFVVDFYKLKTAVNELIVDKMDHAFLARGDEPVLKILKTTGVKVLELGFRTTVENMASYICWKLMREGFPIHSIKMWETPTGWAEVLAVDISIEQGPNYSSSGICDLD